MDICIVCLFTTVDAIEMVKLRQKDDEIVLEREQIVLERERLEIQKRELALRVRFHK